MLSQMLFLRLLLSAFLLQGRHAASTALETHSSGLHTTLAEAGLEHAAATASALRKLGLSNLPEIQLLDRDEMQELREGLRKNEVSLGDRAKLRRAAEIHVIAPLPLTAPFRGLRTEASSNDQDDKISVSRVRQLQAASDSPSVSGGALCARRSDLPQDWWLAAWLVCGELNLLIGRLAQTLSR